jgi:hypothetical protein
MYQSNVSLLQHKTCILAAPKSFRLICARRLFVGFMHRRCREMVTTSTWFPVVTKIFCFHGMSYGKGFLAESDLKHLETVSPIGRAHVKNKDPFIWKMNWTRT